MVVHPLLRRAFDFYTRPSSPKPTTSNGNASATAADARFTQRIQFDFYFALVFIVALHGISALKVLAILYLNYKIAKSLPRRYIPAATWIFNISTLFANELCAGYPLERLAAMLTSTTDATGQESLLVLWGRQLDSFGGLIPRWEILFNFTVLRLISFNMDYYWCLDYPAASPIEVSATTYQLNGALLTIIRRSNLIQQPFQSVIALVSPRNARRSTAAITSRTSCTPRFI